jgi:hypothetical protein
MSLYLLIYACPIYNAFVLKYGHFYKKALTDANSRANEPLHEGGNRSKLIRLSLNFI